MIKSSSWIRLSLAAIVTLQAAGLVRAEATTQPTESVDQLKTDAFRALRSGEFAKTSELIAQAASMSHDSNLEQMSQWLAQFQSQRQTLSEKRAKDRDKVVADVKKLLDNGNTDYAIDKLRDAYLLSEDKDAFRKEPWVSDLFQKAIARAGEAEKQETWLKAQRLYSDLSVMEPTNVAWKDKFKAATARIRLLATYVPDDLKKTIETEFKQREAADAVINPTTKPSTTKPEVEENDSFKIDWHDTLRGIQMGMLVDALDDAQANYWREITYKGLVTGGLKSVRALVTTAGVEKAFPSLSDAGKVNQFIAALDQFSDSINRPNIDEERTTHQILNGLLTANRASLDLPEEVLTNEFAEGAFGTLDPFSTMIWPQDIAEFNRATQGEFSGVGIQIQSDPDDGSLKVISPVEDSPAYRLHIHAGDVITKIDGKNAKGISINQAVQNITGPSGTYVTLTIKSPDGTVHDFQIRRETIKVASVKGFQREVGGAWNYFVDPAQKIAYVRLTQFTKSTEDELNHALAQIQKEGARAIVLDLRANPGGLLTAATEVSDRFLSSGTIVSTRPDRDLPSPPPIEAHKSNDDVKLPVVVLVNQTSASASEIVSGALQDQKRALVVGERSFGKGSVQMMFQLSGHNAELKLTTSHYYLPSGRCIHKEDNSTTWGVDPDVKVEMTVEQLRAAQEARQSLEVLREVDPEAAKAATNPTTGPAKDWLAVDPQLSAAVLLLRLELSGATL